MADFISGQFMVAPVSIQDNEFFKKGKVKNKTTNFIWNVLGKIKGMIFEKSRKSFCKYKFNFEYDNLDQEMERERLRIESIENTINTHPENYNHPLHNTLVLFEKMNEIVRFIF